ncbi:serine/threonine protein kinase [Streptomyces sp. NPDC001373]|uniref:serine/threonine protein kinase n=1 Tax=Streptomyces sp. NPDC001373 TaxID=3364565 RepID=UPI00369F0AA8
MTSQKLYIGPDSAPDRYRLLRSIGRGGEAVIHLAEIELAGGAEPVVVKVLDSKTTISSEEFARISQKWNEQAELLRFVHRPGVVGVREHFEGPPIHPAGEASGLSGRSLVLVMNHVDGLDLRDWRTERDLSTPAGRREVMATLEQLADVLDWLHSGKATPSGRQVVHGDLSPGNVMVDADGQATLVDFGLSKLTAEHRTAEIWFTPGYAAPEVFDGRRTPATDRYAFGAIAYFLLSGESPPRTPGLLAEAMAELPQIAALDAEQRARIAALCAGDPQQRPPSLAGWVQDLRQAVVSLPLGGVQDARPTMRTPGRRRPALMAAAGAVLLAALALTGVKLFGDFAQGDDGGGPDRAGDTRPTAPSASRSPSPPPAASDPGGVSLTTLEPVAKSEYAWFEAGDGTLGSQRYDTALVAAGPYKICDGSASYDLGGSWKTLTMVAGVDDASTHANAGVTVNVDGRSVWSGTLRVGSPRPLSIDVANGKRLDISYGDPGRTCGMGRLVLGAPSLKK